MNPLIDKLQILQPIILETVSDFGYRNHCIETSALLTSVLKLLDVKEAFMLTVRVAIHNKALQEYVRNFGPPIEPESAKACNSFGGATVLVGAENSNTPEGEWDGHVSVVIPNAFKERHALVDLSIMQANKPEYDIEVPPLCLPVPSEFVSGVQPAIYNVHGLKVIYTAFPNDQEFNRHGDCLQKEGLAEVSKEIALRISSKVQ